MRLLVTGAAGFIGSNFVRHWVNSHPSDHVVALDLLTYAGNRPNLADVEDRILFVQADIADLSNNSQLLREEGIDVVVNFAAESHNSLSVIDPTRFFQTNVMGTQALLEASRLNGVSRFHHVSTDEVYGELALDSDELFGEDWPYQPRTPYSASKAGADHAVRAYWESFGLPVSITNCANNYGPYQFPEKMFPLFITLALDDQPMPMYASKDNRREYLHVLDHCRGIERVILEGTPGETYNVGSGVEASIERVADLILDELGKPSSLKKIVPDRPGHDSRYAVNWSKIHRQLGWAPHVEWESGMRETIRWYAANRQWWEPLRTRAPVNESAWETPFEEGLGQ